ncbi:hypothetical protein BJX66DRAFT_297056 [Aspergillus keveii]|uniref:Uncharacterized protein n=1 Tax=Aspergillus keveii TaxID=714993 RepID=A0ABR4GF74_9EURO
MVSVDHTLLKYIIYHPIALGRYGHTLTERNNESCKPGTGLQDKVMNQRERENNASMYIRERFEINVRQKFEKKAKQKALRSLGGIP